MAKRWPRDVLLADRKLMSVAVQPTSDRRTLGLPTVVHDSLPLSTSGSLSPYTYDVMPDGQRSGSHPAETPHHNR